MSYAVPPQERTLRVVATTLRDFFQVTPARVGTLFEVVFAVNDPTSDLLRRMRRCIAS